MTRILFLSERNDTLGPMAETFALGVCRECRESCKIEGVGVSAKAVHPVTVRVMGELGIDLSKYTARTLSDVTAGEIDLVITLSGADLKHGPLFPCCPHQLKWNLADPAGIEGDPDEVLAAFRNARDTVRRLINDLFDKGYFDALMQARRCRDVIMESMTDALLIHDLNRRIVLFNPAAERLTGYSRVDVMDRDCHEVFAGNLCGGKCLLPNGPCEIQESLREGISIAHKDGSPVAVERSVRRLENLRGEVMGAVVLFHDKTREQRLERRVRETESFAGLVGRDEKMIEIYDLIRDLAESNIPVLIQGESGTGKELVAAAMHNEGPRAGKLFVPVNCGSLPETLLESELFGHVRGAFTGAIRDKKGRFEMADGGTIFLDEIGDISPAMQVKLLRVLQEGEFVRVGSEETVKVNVRVVSATNKNLTEEIAAGRFREDLYYRLSVMPLWIPPLRERRNDIPILAEHVLEKLRQETGRTNVTISPEAMNILISHDWPGNVRELQNWIQFAMVKCKGGDIKPEHLPSSGLSGALSPGISRRRKLDKEAVRLAIEQASGNKSRAAAILGVSRATLYRFLG